MTTKLPIRYIPNKLTRKDKQKQNAKTPANTHQMAIGTVVSGKNEWTATPDRKAAMAKAGLYCETLNIKPHLKIVRLLSLRTLFTLYTEPVKIQ